MNKRKTLYKFRYKLLVTKKLEIQTDIWTRGSEVDSYSQSAETLVIYILGDKNGCMEHLFVNDEINVKGFIPQPGIVITL